MITSAISAGLELWLSSRTDEEFKKSSFLGKLLTFHLWLCSLL